MEWKDGGVLQLVMGYLQRQIRWRARSETKRNCEGTSRTILGERRLVMCAARYRTSVVLLGQC